MPPRYHPFKAILVAIGNAIPLIILPVYALRTIPTLLPGELPLDLPFDLQALERTIITFGLVVVVLAAATAFFSKGLAPRVLFGGARQGSRVAWIHAVLSGGLISLTVPLFDVATVSFFLDMLRLLYILYAALLVMALYFVVEYFVYRGQFRAPSAEYAAYATP